MRLEGMISLFFLRFSWVVFFFLRFSLGVLGRQGQTTAIYSEYGTFHSDPRLHRPHAKSFVDRLGN